MSDIKNILFIMADQLRWDYLSCYGHPHLHTPNIDQLAENGVRFDRAYVQSPVCGPSRASFYTGRTVFSHGATWNGIPLPTSELTLGDYLRPHGIRTAVIGKSHLYADREGLARLGLAGGAIGNPPEQPCFEPFERDDGIHPKPLERQRGSELPYNIWLRELGYVSDNPWDDFANSAVGVDGEILSGWSLRNSNLPARVKEEHSETAYMTLRAREFIDEAGDQPWLCHLSYIKPHWPYIAPAPYHDMYGPDSFLPMARHEHERIDPHPVVKGFMDLEVSRAFSKAGVRDRVLSGYMGLIKQIDDNLGRLFQWLDDTGRSGETMIVFTSDHGDYLGDHWLGEKELFHDCSVRVPLIIHDPRPEADPTRGSVSDALVEAIDLVPTFLDATGAPPANHRLEGRSLLPLLQGATPDDWREAAFSEIDYSFYRVRKMLGVGIDDARGYMICTKRWKYVYFHTFPAQLFDLQNDPAEYHDLGNDPAHGATRTALFQLLAERLMKRKNRITIDDAGVERQILAETSMGIKIGQW